jgi:hypothetical protein
MFRRGLSTSISPTAASIRLKSLATICRSRFESRSVCGSMPLIVCCACSTRASSSGLLLMLSRRNRSKNSRRFSIVNAG